MRVGIYTIAKNEQQNVTEWFKSCAGADTITFCDTGSTDKTREAARAFLVDGRMEVHDIALNPFRFDDAHNAALMLVPRDVDVCFPLHLDERLTPGWREALEEAWTPGVTKASYDYHFAPTLQFRQNRVHARFGYRWMYPAHEGLYQTHEFEEKQVFVEKFKIIQHQDLTKPRSSLNLSLLRQGLIEYPTSTRMQFYWARELMYAKDFAGALREFKKYVAMEKPFHPQEEAWAYDHMANCVRHLGNAR